MNTTFIQEFKNKEDIIKQFEIQSKELDGARIKLAWYGYGSYCGDCLVVFERGGKLYEVNASHCSCNGIEGQWSPEETTWEALGQRKFYSSCDGENEAGKKLQALVKRNLKKSGTKGKQ